VWWDGGDGGDPKWIAGTQREGVRLCQGWSVSPELDKKKTTTTKLWRLGVRTCCTMWRIISWKRYSVLICSHRGLECTGCCRSWRRVTIPKQYATHTKSCHPHHCHHHHQQQITTSSSSTSSSSISSTITTTSSSSSLSFHHQNLISIQSPRASPQSAPPTAPTGDGVLGDVVAITTGAPLPEFTNAVIGVRNDIWGW